MDVIDKPFVSEDDRFNYLTGELSKEIMSTFKGKKMPSLQDQLADI